MKHAKLYLVFLAVAILPALHVSCRKEKKEEPRFFSPSNLTAIPYNDSTIRVSWTDNSDAEDVFEIHRKTADEAFKLVKTNNANDTVFVDSDVESNKKYTYRVRAKNKIYETAFSDEASVTLNLPTPVLQASAINDVTVRLSWTDDSALEAGFVLERANGSSAFAELARLGKNITTYDDGTVQVNQEYKYRIKAFNKTTETGYSNATSTQINFNAPTLTTSFPGGNTVDLTWSDNSQFEKGFIIEQSANDGAYKEIGRVDSTILNYKVDNLEKSKRYVFKTKAYSDKNTSAYSNTKRIYYAEKRYVITETYPALPEIDGLIAISPSSDLLAATGGARSANIQLINRQSGTVSKLGTMHNPGTYAIKFSNDSKYLLVTSVANGTVEILDFINRTVSRRINTGLGAVYCLSFNKSGNMLAVGGSGGSKIVVYNYPAMTVRYTVPVGSETIYDLRFYNNDTRLISCGTSDKIKFWRLLTGTLEKTIGDTPGSITKIDINSNSSMLTSGNNYYLKIWGVSGNALASIAVGTHVTSTFWGADDFVYFTSRDNLQIVDKLGNLIETTSIGSNINYADINKGAKLITVTCENKSIYVLSNMPVWKDG